MKTLRVFVCASVISIFTHTALAIAKDEKEPDVAAKAASPDETAKVSSPDVAAKVTSPDVVAKVNSKEILMEDVNIFVKPILERAKVMGQQVTPELEKTIRQQWIEHLIARRLLLDKADSAKIVVSEEEIKKNTANPQYRNVNISDDKLRELVKGDLMINNIIESNIMSKVSITDKEVEEFYNERKNELIEPEQVKARHILFRVGASDPQEKKDEQLKKAKEVLKEAKNGKADFSELANKYSEEPSDSRGGDLGYFARGRMVPAFENAAFALKKDEISDVVETQFGYHIIKVEDKKDARNIPFDEIKDAVRENIKIQRGNVEIEKWIDQLKSEATIEMIE